MTEELRGKLVQDSASELCAELDTGAVGS